jgi:hypothetical protein
MAISKQRLRAIDKLIAELVDDYELPLTEAAIKQLGITASATNIPIREIWEAEAHLRYNKIWHALTELRGEVKP